MSGAGVVVTLAEVWNGTSWKIQATPNPTGARASSLLGVSCSSTSACTAVGRYTTSTGEVLALAESWNGKSWQIQAAPNPTGATASSLFGVSCTSASACISVGNYTSSAGNQVTLAESWNGASWQIQVTPSPTGTMSNLFGVSCSATSACIAVGSYTNSGGVQVTLAEGWNGTGWQLQTTPNPSGAIQSNLFGVSCTAATACVAVGGSNDPGSVTLTEVWNGASWQIQTTPNPAGPANPLSGVSCASSTACTAVSSYLASDGITVTFAEQWNGTTWQVQTTPNPTGAQFFLDGVSCRSASACTAVGELDSSSGSGANQLTLAENWNGSAWTIQFTVNATGAEPSALSAVSCSSASACSAVGNYTNSGGQGVFLAEGWDGTSWKLQTTPGSTAVASALPSLSCPSATACTAVGYQQFCCYLDFTAALQWNGTSWAGGSPANPGPTWNQLSGVSCTSAINCTAVGYYDYGADGQLTLAEVWNGTTWLVQTTQNPGGPQSLVNVSCTSVSACTAVGYYQSGADQVTLAEVWNGASWQVQTTPNPIGATSSVLTDVSCTSATACTAVGHYKIGKSQSQHILVEGWDGTTWTIQHAPNPKGTTSSNLTGVSCTSASACTAVGSAGSTKQAAFAERWNGTSWKLETLSIPQGSEGTSLTSVSCTSGTACTAVGGYTSSGGVPVTLIEDWSG
jgi:hypothetical protein